MIIKVCGVRTPEIAEVAIDAGADWIGLVFEPRSPRHLDDDQARAVRHAVGSAADCVGVMVARGALDADRIATDHRLAAMQLHGQVAEEVVETVDVPVIRGLNVLNPRQALTVEWWPDGLLLLDSVGTPGSLPGGTGARMDWDAAAQVAAHRRIILAGGLDASNVAEAIATVRPWGVDASSGLEQTPGKKDPARVRAFVTSARAAFAALAAERPA